MTLAEFRTAMPQFSTVSDALVQLALDEAALFVGDLWGAYAPLGFKYYAAHSLVFGASLAGGSISALDTGGVISKTVGSVSITRSAALVESETTVLLNTTQYGRLFLYYQRLIGTGIVVV